jgi:hypothetical protein
VACGERFIADARGKLAFVQFLLGVAKVRLQPAGASATAAAGS